MCVEVKLSFFYLILYHQKKGVIPFPGDVWILKGFETGRQEWKRAMNKATFIKWKYIGLNNAIFIIFYNLSSLQSTCFSTKSWFVKISVEELMKHMTRKVFYHNCSDAKFNIFIWIYEQLVWYYGQFACVFCRKVNGLFSQLEQNFKLL